MKHVRQQDFPAPNSSNGLARVTFEGINLRFLEARQGDTVENHGHENPEELVLLSGKIRQNAQVLEAGDVLRTEAGESHDFEALEDSCFIVVNPRE